MKAKESNFAFVLFSFICACLHGFGRDGRTLGIASAAATNEEAGGSLRVQVVGGPT
jgi:hypothetical protein